MRILIFLPNSNNFQVFCLPNIVDGNYWITYENEEGFTKNFLNVYSVGENWVFENEISEFISLNFFTTYLYKEIRFMTCPLYDSTMDLFYLNDLNRITIGSVVNDISFQLLLENQITLSFNNGNWFIQNNKPTKSMYINKCLTSGKVLENGEQVFIEGLTFIIFSNFLVMNNPLNQVDISNRKIEKKQIPIVKETMKDTEISSIYEKKDFFYRSPRFRNLIQEVHIRIDAPPNTPIKESLPMLLQMGGMLTMGMSSMVTLLVSVSSLFSGERTFISVFPSLIIGISMLIGMLLIPTLSRRYQKKQTLKQEAIRQEKYSEYLNSKKNEIYKIMEIQQQSLNANSISFTQCEDIILHYRRNLWERKIEHDDFLTARIGVGEIPAKIKIDFPEEHFTLENDNLKNKVFQLASTPRNLKDVPINISFIEKNICAILGNFELIPSFFNAILLQFITFHSYEDLKFVIFTNKKNKENWKSMKDLPYLWDNARTFRYYGETKEEKFSIATELNEIFKKRKYQDEDYSKETKFDYRNFLPYYVIITDDFQSIRDFEFIKNATKSKVNFGFSFLIINQRLMGLPNECNSFINIDANQSGIIENELASDHQQVFKAEVLKKPLERCFEKVTNIPIEIASEKNNFPKSLSFLEMYNVGKVEQLNALNQWKLNRSYDSLKAPVGVDQNGSIFMLDLHEKVHGPHGLIAGMTGSGKSEFIITYILSMALNYHPDDVAFVLIDYKGGGLAGAFENKEMGVKLPHLAGTITNLDTVEIKRSLASIESELKRRQRLFNEARNQTKESTINIYKYQKLYHDGIVKEAIPHLFIISDEFAELKTQQPEFMAQLISTARIGRSLGVHLILATQKPSGVVDAQIWSNSKFRVCLKVQDKADSMDMIKVPDAAALTNVGRFFLQVGYNEFFALGQSAWCGAPYYEMDERKKKIDSSLDYINNIGKITNSIEQDSFDTNSVFKGEELPAILNYLSDIAKKEKIETKSLWLPNIPEFIYIEELEMKYDFISQPYFLNEVIGEYDDPSTQSQFLLKLPISQDGNVLLYGSIGSGKEIFLKTFLYSTILHHTVEEVQIYILDFGSESLQIFAECPQIGNIVFSSEYDKIINLFKMLNEFVEERKKVFMNFGGSYQSFIEKSNDKMPNIIVIINNYENFNELYPDLDDELSSITRESSKFGIYFIITTNGANSVRLKITQNFKQVFCLQMNTNDDYFSILGNVHKTYPSKKSGRGLLKQNNEIYEFQTAYAKKSDDLSESIKKTCHELNLSSLTKAKKIPVLPEHVSIKDFEDKEYDMSQVMVGIEKNSLKESKYNFKKSILHIVTAQEKEDIIPFCKGFIESIQSVRGNVLFVIDSNKLLSMSDYDSKYFFQDNFSKVLQMGLEYLKNMIEDYNIHSVENRKDKYLNFTLVILGLENFLNQLGENGTIFENLIQEGKKIDKLTIILFDSFDILKKHEFDRWYKDNIMNSQGIWIGNGITDQYTLKLSKTPKYCYEEINSDFGYVVKNGIPIQVKLLESEKNNE